MGNPALLALEDVSFAHPGGRQVLVGVTLAIGAGEEVLGAVAGNPGQPG